MEEKDKKELAAEPNPGDRNFTHMQDALEATAEVTKQARAPPGCRGSASLSLSHTPNCKETDPSL